MTTASGVEWRGEEGRETGKKWAVAHSGSSSTTAFGVGVAEWYKAKPKPNPSAVQSGARRGGSV